MLEPTPFLYMCWQLCTYIPVALFISLLIVALSLWHSRRSMRLQSILIIWIAIAWAAHVLVSQAYRIPTFSLVLPPTSLHIASIVWFGYFALFFLFTKKLQQKQLSPLRTGTWLFCTLFLYHLAHLAEKSIL